MARTAIKYGLLVEGLDEQAEIVDQIASTPSYKVIGRLEQNLRRAFLNTQARAHVISGHMKASGRTESSWDGEVWDGSIEYGVMGDANWSQDPRISYAIFEMARGGDHNFFGDLPLFHDGYMEALEAHFGE